MQLVANLVHEFVTMCAFFNGIERSIAYNVTRQWWQMNMTPPQGLDTIEQYIDQYLNLAGFEMTSREFFE